MDENKDLRDNNDVREADVLLGKMEFHRRLVLRTRADDENVFDKIKMIVRIIEKTHKYNFTEYGNVHNSELSSVTTWLDKENQHAIIFDRNLTIPAISIVLQSNEARFVEFLTDFLMPKLEIYSTDGLKSISQELVDRNSYALRFAGLGTYFLKPYPEHMMRIIGDNIFSENKEIAKSAVIAAGLSGKEFFKFLLMEFVKDETDEELIRAAEASLKHINYFEKNLPQFYKLDED